MFYQEALPKFRFLSRVDSLLTIRDRQALRLKKPNQQIHFRLHGTGAFSCGVTIFVWVLTSKVTTPQDAHRGLVLQVYLGSNTLEFSAIHR